MISETVRPAFEEVGGEFNRQNLPTFIVGAFVAVSDANNEHNRVLIQP